MKTETKYLKEINTSFNTDWLLFVNVTGRLHEVNGLIVHHEFDGRSRGTIARFDTSEEAATALLKAGWIRDAKFSSNPNLNNFIKFT